MTFVNNNAPEALVELCKKWDEENKIFYLGPENIFLYNNAPVNYYGADNVSRECGEWNIHSENCLTPPYQFLRKEEIEEIAEAFAQNTHPQNATLFLGNKCCSRCFMCWYHGEDTSYYNEYLKDEQVQVDFNTAKEWIDKLCEAGIENISIASNGETLMLPYWEELMRYTAKKGLTQYFITNGMFFTEEVAKKLKEIGNITCAEVSIHGTDFETWSKVTRIKNKKLFENVINTPLLMKKYVTDNVYIAFVKTERNIHNFKEFLDFWVPKGFHITSKYKLTDNDIPGNNYYKQFNEPCGLCANLYGNLYVMPSGKVIPCGGYYFCGNINPDFYKNLPNIKDLTPENLKNFNKRKISNTQRLVCSECFNYYRRNISITKTVYGYPATCDGVSDRIALNLKKKKTIKQRIKNEYNSAKKKLTRLLK